jgi:hypothetical protein
MKCTLLIVVALCASVCSASTPSQIHLAQADVTGLSMFVSWLTPHTLHNDSVVRFGSSPNDLSQSGTWVDPGFQYTYQSQYMSSPYTSGWFYHFVMPGLKPSTKYYYQCGSPSAGMSDVLSFGSPPVVRDASVFFQLHTILLVVIEANLLVDHLRRSARPSRLYLAS